MYIILYYELILYTITHVKEFVNFVTVHLRLNIISSKTLWNPVIFYWVIISEYLKKYLLLILNKCQVPLVYISLFSACVQYDIKYNTIIHQWNKRLSCCVYRIRLTKCNWLDWRYLFFWTCLCYLGIFFYLDFHRFWHNNGI